MPTLKDREEKLQKKRKKTSFRDFVMEIASRGALNLYRHQGQISIYPNTPRKPKNLVSMQEYAENVNLLTQMGVEYTGDFFADFKRLSDKTYTPMLRNMYAENSDFCGNVWHANNAYLSFAIVNAENVCYSFHIKEYSRNVFNSTTVRDHCENIYASHSILRSQNIFYSRNITDSYENWFCSDMLGCQHCLFCHGLQNQSYCINNQKYSKEDYMIEKQKLLAQKENFEQWALQARAQGDYFFVQSSQIENARNVYRVQGGRNLVNAGSIEGNRNFYDLVMGGSPRGSDFYGDIYIGPGEHIYCSDYIAGDQHIYYSHFLDSCSFCLGCIGLQNKSFCILNKQYSKEERYQKINQIFQKMEKTPHPNPFLRGEGANALGAFFPGSLCPYYFNDTVAYMLDDSFSKEEVEAQGYLWRDKAIKVDIPKEMEVVDVKELGEYETLTPSPSSSERGARHIAPSILKKVIRDEKGNVYRIVKMEYDFLMKYALPLPRTHRLERIRMGFMHPEKHENKE